ncbi:MAG TPA: 6-phosphogluconolactonase [Blastocatellia bacterium]|nr:6-phosphogluconolactonase [Blastocatellia bacterium]
MSTRMLQKPNATVRVYPDAAELALKAARRFARLADQYVIGCGRFTVALSGGSTPRAMFSILAADPFLDTVPWSSIYFFWGDERSVPPDHPDSNYRMATEALLSKVPVPSQNIFRVPAEMPAQRAAEEYASTLRSFFLSGPGKSKTGTAPLSNVPRLDLVFLGMGPDGHTASLFPHTPALHAGEHDIVVANYVEKFKAHRITFTTATINNARNVTFLVAGADKADVLKEVIEGRLQPDVYPSQLIRPLNGSLLWMIDEPAARLLSDFKQS